MHWLAMPRLYWPSGDTVTTLPWESRGSRSSQREEVTREAKADAQASLNQAVADEQQHWSASYRIGSQEEMPEGMAESQFGAHRLFKKRIDHIAYLRDQIMLLQSQGRLSEENFSELLAETATRAAIAFGWVDSGTCDWMDDVKKLYMDAGTVYGWGSWFYGMWTQLPRILLSATNLAIEIDIIYHPEHACEGRIFKSFINVLYAFIQLVALRWSNTSNGRDQSDNVANAASMVSQPYAPTASTSKRLDEDGKTKIGLRTTKQAKFDLHLVERLRYSIEKHNRRSVKAQWALLSQRIAEKNKIINKYGTKNKKGKKLSTWEDSEVKRLTAHVKLLGELESIADNVIRNKTVSTDQHLTAIQPIWTDVIKEKVVAELYAQAVQTWWAGYSRGFWRNSFNVIYSAATLIGHCHTLQSLIAGSDSSIAPEYPNLLMCPGKPHTTSGVPLVVAITAFLSATLQVPFYRSAVNRFFGNDLLSKLLTLMTITLATGPGNLRGLDKQVDPEKIDKLVKGPRSLSIEQMSSVCKSDLSRRVMQLAHWFFPGPIMEYEGWSCTPAESVCLSIGKVSRDHDALVAALLRPLENDKIPLGDRVDTFRTVVRELSAACQVSSVAAGKIKSLQDLCEFDAQCMCWLADGNVDAFLNSPLVSEETRRIFRLALEGAGDRTNPEHRDAAITLAKWMGATESRNYRANRFQVGNKDINSLASLLFGTASPLVVSVVANWLVEGLHAGYGYDDPATEKAIVGIKMLASAVSVYGSTVSIPAAFGFPKHTLSKNVLRSEADGVPDVANAGVGLDSFFNEVTNFDMIALNNTLPHLLRKERYAFRSDVNLFSIVKRQLFALDLHILDLYPGSTTRRLIGFMKKKQGELSRMSDDELVEMIKEARKAVVIPIDGGKEPDGKSRPDPYSTSKRDGNTIHTEVPTTLHAKSSDENCIYLHARFGGQWMAQPVGDSKIYWRKVAFTNAKEQPDGKGHEWYLHRDVDRCRKRNERLTPLSAIHSYHSVTAPTRAFHQRETGANCTVAALNILRSAYFDQYEKNQHLDRLITVADVAGYLRNKGVQRESDFFVEDIVDFHNKIRKKEGTPPIVAMTFDSAGKPLAVNSEPYEANDGSLLEYARRLENMGICFTHGRVDQEPSPHTVVIQFGKGHPYVMDPSCRTLLDIGNQGDDCLQAALAKYRLSSHRFPEDHENTFEVFFFDDRDLSLD